MLSERTEEVLELSHITKLLAVIQNEAYNTLICSLFEPELGQRKVYEMGWQNITDKGAEVINKSSDAIHGDSLFGDGVKYDYFKQTYTDDWTFKSTPLTDQYNLENLLETNPESTRLIGAIDKTGYVYFYPWDKGQKLDDSEVVISYVPPENNSQDGKK